MQKTYFSRTSRLVLLITCLFLSTLATAQEYPALRGGPTGSPAGLELVASEVPLVIHAVRASGNLLTLELMNDSEHRLVGWVLLFDQVSTRVASRHVTEHALAYQRQRMQGIEEPEIGLPPGGRWTLEVPRDRQPSRVTVAAALASDGSTWGPAEELRRLHALWQEYKESLEDKLGELDAAERRLLQGEDRQQVLREINVRLRGSQGMADLDQDPTAASFGLAPISLWRESLAADYDLLEQLLARPAGTEAATAASTTDCRCSVAISRTAHTATCTIDETYSSICVPESQTDRGAVAGQGECDESLLGGEARCWPQFRTVLDGSRIDESSARFQRTVGHYQVKWSSTFTSYSCERIGGSGWETTCPCPPPQAVPPKDEPDPCASASSIPNVLRAAQCGENTDFCNSSDCYTPLVIDLHANGFRFTALDAGVAFDVDGDGRLEQTSWTLATGDEAFLVLDRDGDGRIGSAAELFGDATPQPVSAEPNGFKALAVLDANGDGLITDQDPAFAELRLWRDANHDGSSQAAELTALAAAGVVAIELDYRESLRRDRWGNHLRYRANVYLQPGTLRGQRVRTGIVDVFLQLASP